MCTYSSVFSLISWLCVIQSGQNTYQTKAEYPSYEIISTKPLLKSNLKTYIYRRVQNIKYYILLTFS